MTADVEAHTLRPGAVVVGPFRNRTVEAVSVQPESIIGAGCLLTEAEWSSCKRAGVLVGVIDHDLFTWESRSTSTPRWGPGVLVHYAGQETPSQYKVRSLITVEVD